jgi:hypothetical protein
MQHNEEENVIKEELQFVNNVVQFHTPKRVKYIKYILYHEYLRQKNDLQVIICCL